MSDKIYVADVRDEGQQWSKEDVPHGTSVEVYIEEVMNQGQGFVVAITSERYKEEQDEKQRKNMEWYCRSLMRQFSIPKIDSYQMLDALHNRIADIQDSQTGMHEDGLCMGYGVTPDQWYDEYNAYGSEIGIAHEVLGWLETEFPMLCAAYRKQTKGEHDGEADKA